MNIKVITGPDREPVTLAEAKAQIRVDEDVTFEDDYILSLIATAREVCEEWQSRAYLTQTLQASFDNVPEMPIEIPRPPLQSISEILLKSKNGEELRIELNKFHIDTLSEPGRIFIENLPQVDLAPIGCFIITYKAGHSRVTNVSNKVKQAIKMLVGYWYENREAAMDKVPQEIEFAVSSLLRKGKVRYR